MSDKSPTQNPADLSITGKQAEHIIDILSDIRTLVAMSNGFAFNPETKKLTPLCSREESIKERQEASDIMSQALLKCANGKV